MGFLSDAIKGVTGGISDVLDFGGSAIGAGAGYMLGGIPGALIGGGLGSSFSAGRQADAAARYALTPTQAFQREDQLRAEDWKKTIWLLDRNQETTIQRRVSDAKKAGLSPLAAMGAAGTSIPNIQGSFGTRPRQPNTHPVTDATSGLLNYFLQDKIVDKQIKLMELQHQGRLLGANSDDAAEVRPPVYRAPHPSEGKPGHGTWEDGKKFTIPAGTPHEVIEREIGEWALLMPSTMQRAWKIFKSQLRDDVTVHRFRQFAAANNMWSFIPERLWKKYGYVKKTPAKKSPSGPIFYPVINDDSA